MKTFSDQHYTLALPDDWVVEKEADYTCFYHPDGVGALLISSFEYDQAVTEDDLEEFAADHIDNDFESEEVEYGNFSGFSFCYEIDDEYLCEWYLKSGSYMLFITYSCDLADEENSEEDIVESMLSTLLINKN